MMTLLLLAGTFLPIHVTARPSRYTAIEANPKNSEQILVGTSKGHVLRSIDGGASWTTTTLIPKAPRTWGEEHHEAAQSVGLGIKADASPRLQIMLVERGITPAAMNMIRTMQKVNNPPTHINEIAIDPNNPRRVFAGAADGLYRSRDGGQSFTRIFGPEAGVFNTAYGREVLTVAIDPFDANSVLIGTYDGLFVSRDGGWGFRLIPGGEGMAVRKIAFHPTEAGVVFIGTTGGLLRSDDGGDTMGGIYAPESFTAGDINALATSGSTVLVGTGESVIVSNQMGDPGTFMQLLLPSQRIYRVAAIDPDDEKHLIVGAEDGLYESRDGGRSWTTLKVGTYEPEHYFSPALLAIPPPPVAPRDAPRDAMITGGRLYAATLNGLYRRDDQTQVGSPINDSSAQPLPPLREVETRAMRHLRIEFSDYGRMRDRAMTRNLLPDVEASFKTWRRTVDRARHDFLYAFLPFRFLEDETQPRETRLMFTATWDLPGTIYHPDTLSHKTLVNLRLREVRSQVEEEVRRRWMSYQLARELDLRANPDNRVLRQMYALSMQENLAYLDAVTGGVHETVSLD